MGYLDFFKRITIVWGGVEPRMQRWRPFKIVSGVENGDWQACTHRASQTNSMIFMNASRPSTNVLRCNTKVM